MPETTDALARAVEIRLPRQRIERRTIAWWLLRAILACGLPLAGLVAAAALWEPARVWLAAPIVAVGVILLAKLAVEPFWRYAVHRWEITEQATYAVTGWLVKESRVAPSSRIQTVDAVRGPLEQLLGLSTLRVTTASSYGAIRISGLDRAVAEDAVARLSVVAELSEGDAT
ncbi:PH domain-containing protein [Tessaracoccus terricola]